MHDGHHTLGAAIMCANLGEIMSLCQKAPFNQESCLLTNLSRPSKRLQKTALFLALCSVGSIPGSGYGQTSSNGTATGQAAKICDGTIRPSKSALQVSQAGEVEGKVAGAGSVEPGSGSKHLRLSTKAGEQEVPAPQGLFCNRDSSDSDLQSLTPTASHPQEPVPANRPPATPPIAELTNGKLTIRANGQDLFSVLDAVRSVTGITVDMPVSQSPDPVFMNAGPLSTQDVLMALLEGTKYNYVIVGSEKDSQLVTRLVLSEQNNKPATPLVTSAQAQAVTSQPELYGGQGVEVADTDPQASQPPPGPPPIQPAATPSSVPTGINLQQLAAQSGKTTNQILDELQKRQLQQLDDQSATQAQPPQ